MTPTGAAREVRFNSELEKYGRRFLEDWALAIDRDTTALFGERAIKAELTEHSRHYFVRLTITWRKGVTFTSEASASGLERAWIDAMAIALRAIGQMATKV